MACQKVTWFRDFDTFFLWVLLWVAGCNRDFSNLVKKVQATRIEQKADYTFTAGF